MISEKDRQRFWSKVDKRGPDECWPWTAAIGNHGYGVMGIGTRTHTAHRISYIIANGGIPHAGGHHGGVVMHTCDNRACCNPNHLIAADQKTNLRDMFQKGRRGRAARGTECRTNKLRDDDVREIRSRYTRGLGGELAREFGVSVSQIHSIIKNKSWKWME